MTFPKLLSVIVCFGIQIQTQTHREAENKSWLKMIFLYISDIFKPNERNEKNGVNSMLAPQ